MNTKVLITGVSTGLGNALAYYALSHGDTVYAIGRNVDQRLLEKSDFHFVSCDLSDLKNIQMTVEKLLQEAGSFDLVILNAGMLGEIKEMQDTKIEEIEEVLRLNVWANKVLFDLLISLEIPVKQIVGISSGAAVNASKGWGSYSISKSTLNMLLKLYAHELPDTHITALAPGVIETPMVHHIIDEVDDVHYPSAKRLKEGEIQSPKVAAKRLFETFDKLFAYESGAFLDIRDM